MRFISAVLYRMRPADPAAFLAAAAAGVLDSWRATQLEPMAALRYE
jgi:hypothetical protein